MKTIIIKITRAGTRVGPFDVYDHLGNVIASNISRAEMIAGITLIVNDNVTSVKLKSAGKCTDEQTKKVGVVAPYQLVEESTFTNTPCLWKHNIPNIFNTYYGNIEPYVLEHSYSYSYHDEILQSVKDFTKAYHYYPDGLGEFNYSNKVETDREFFNNCIIYNGQQSSGLLELVPKPKNNLQSYMQYPLFRSDRKVITYTKSDNFYNLNNFWNIVKDRTQPLFITDCTTLSGDKKINDSNMDYSSRSFRKDQIRAKDVKIRYILNDRSDLHLVSQINFISNQISYK